MSRKSIAVFDSGLGGLTVFQALKRILPQENIIYLADNNRIPYGSCSKESIIQYTHEAISFLQKQNVKMVVLACHTASVCSLNEKFSIPVLGVIQGGIRAISEIPNCKKVAILGTERTIKSGVYEQALMSQMDVVSVAIPRLASMIESQDPEVEAIVREYVKYLKVDAVLLGCTHYPLIRPVFEKVIGQGTRILDSAEKTAMEAREFLKRGSLLNIANEPVYQFYATADAEHFGQKALFFLGENIHPVLCKID